MRLHRLLIVCALAWLGLPSQAVAGWSCGIDESLLPQIYALEVIDDRLVAYVGPIESGSDGNGAGATVIAIDEQGTWTAQPRSQIPTRQDSVSSEACVDPPPDEEWLRANRPWWDPENHYFEQEIGVCATGVGKRWGGISFYGGEGYGGVGGILAHTDRAAPGWLQSLKACQRR